MTREVARVQDSFSPPTANNPEEAADGPPFDGCAEHGVYPCRTCRRIKVKE